MVADHLTLPERTFSAKNAFTVTASSADNARRREKSHMSKESKPTVSNDGNDVWKLDLRINSGVRNEVVPDKRRCAPVQ